MKRQVAKEARPSEVREIRAEYDFTGGVRGKHAARYAKVSNIVVIDPDVAKVFPDSESVNEALRALLPIIRRRRKQPAEATASK